MINKVSTSSFLVFFLFFFSYAEHEQYMIQTCKQCIATPEWFDQQTSFLIDNEGSKNKSERGMFCEDYDRPLFNYYPELKGKIPHVSFASLPTPVEKIEYIAQYLGIKSLYIKQDSKTGKCNGDTRLFGGNKVRKLEFLLADALYNNAQTVMTFGAAGSNHVLATCTYAHELGLNVIAMMMPQPKNEYVLRNIMLDAQTGAQLLYYPSKELRNFGALHAFIWNKITCGTFPYVIPTGGSCPIGALGFVNAALELKDQMQQGELVQPDMLVVPSGSHGTITGLLLGFTLTRTPIHICSVSVGPEEFDGQYVEMIRSLFEKTNALLHAHDATIPMVGFPVDQLTIINDFSGKDYGVPTQEADAAVELMKNMQNIELDPTYSGKAFAYVVAHAQAGRFKDKTVLFWNTYSEYSKEMQATADTKDYTQLPPSLHNYCVS